MNVLEVLVCKKLDMSWQRGLTAQKPTVSGVASKEVWQAGRGR